VAAHRDLQHAGEPLGEGGVVLEELPHLHAEGGPGVGVLRPGGRVGDGADGPAAG
jgi:hypothetical protein